MNFNRIYKSAIVVMSIILVVQAVYLVITISNTGNKFNARHLVSGAHFPHATKDGVYYYNGSNFAYYDLASDSTKRVTSIRYIKDITGVLWLNNGLVFSTNNGNSVKSWYADYSSGEPKLLDIGEIDKSYQDKTKSFIVNKSNYVFFFDNNDYTKNGKIQIPPDENVVNKSGNHVWTYSSSNNTVRSRKLDSGLIDQTYRQEQLVSPLHIDSVGFIYQHSPDSHDSFNLKKYIFSSGDSIDIMNDVTGELITGESLFFADIRLRTLVFWKIEDKPFVSGYIDNPNVTYPRSISQTNHGLVYSTYKDDLYKLSADKRPSSDESSKVGIEVYNKNKSISLVRLITSKNVNSYDIYYDDSNLSLTDTQNYIEDLFSKHGYDINKYSLNYITIN